MLDPKEAIRPAIVIIIAGILAFGAWAFLTHWTWSNSYLIKVPFQDTKGILPQSPLLMNGVSIGSIKSIHLNPITHIPTITLQIEKKYPIPVDSTFIITSGLLVANPQIEVIPGVSHENLANGAIISPNHARVSGALETISPQMSATVKLMNQSLLNLTKHANIVLGKTDKLLDQLNSLTQSANRLIGNKSLQANLEESVANLRRVTDQAAVTAKNVSTQIRQMLARNAPKFDKLANGAVDLLQRLGDTVDAARGAVAKLSEQVSNPRLQQGLQDTLELAKTTIARFSQIATDIHELTGNPQVQQNLRSSVENLKNASSEGEKILGKVNKIVNKIKIPSSHHLFGIGTPKFQVDFLERAQAPHFRSDVNIELPIGAQNAFDLGVYGFTQQNRLNAQYQTFLGNNTDLRYGIYASKLGVGLDWQPVPGTLFTIDAFDPHKGRLNARGLFRINNRFSLWFGGDDIFRHTTPIMGVRMTP